MSGTTSIRFATFLGSIAPGFEFYRFVQPNMARQMGHDEERLFFALAFAGLAAGAAAFLALWFLGYPVLRGVALLIRSLVARHVPAEAWMLATDRALRIAPYAALLGAATWIAYSIGPYRGWPGGVVFGTLGNLIGAWVYGSLLVSWYSVSRGIRSLT